MRKTFQGKWFKPSGIASPSSLFTRSEWHLNHAHVPCLSVSWHSTHICSDTGKRITYFRGDRVFYILCAACVAFEFFFSIEFWFLSRWIYTGIYLFSFCLSLPPSFFHSSHFFFQYSFFLSLLFSLFSVLPSLYPSFPLGLGCHRHFLLPCVSSLPLYALWPMITLMLCSGCGRRMGSGTRGGRPGGSWGYRTVWILPPPAGVWPHFSNLPTAQTRKAAA